MRSLPQWVVPCCVVMAAVLLCVWPVFLCLLCLLVCCFGNIGVFVQGVVSDSCAAHSATFLHLRHMLSIATLCSYVQFDVAPCHAGKMQTRKSTRGTGRFVYC